MRVSPGMGLPVSVFHLFNLHLSSSYCVPGPVVGNKDVEMNQIRSDQCLRQIQAHEFRPRQDDGASQSLEGTWDLPSHIPTSIMESEVGHLWVGGAEPHPQEGLFLRETSKWEGSSRLKVTSNCLKISGCLNELVISQPGKEGICAPAEPGPH